MTAEGQEGFGSDALPQRNSGTPEAPLTPLSEVPPLPRFWRYWMKDHAFLRAVLPNAYRVDGDIWRAAHPGRGLLKRLKAAGLAGILNLRGDGDTVPNAVERHLCEQLGLPILYLEMRAGSLPRRETLQDLLLLLRNAPKPLLLHCKSGADRTALAVTLYLHVLKGVPLAEARRAFSWRYGHIRWGKARVLHVFLDSYAAAHAETGIGFEAWLAEVYDRDRLEATLR